MFEICKRNIWQSPVYPYGRFTLLSPIYKVYNYIQYNYILLKYSNGIFREHFWGMIQEHSFASFTLGRTFPRIFHRNIQIFPWNIPGILLEYVMLSGKLPLWRSKIGEIWFDSTKLHSTGFNMFDNFTLHAIWLKLIVFRNFWGCLLRIINFSKF